MCTVLPTKSDSDVMFVYKVIRDLESIDHLCINPISRKLKWSVQVSVLLNIVNTILCHCHFWLARQ